ncbi:FAD/NAD(P)-binding protein [Kutzneria viridogrisea]|uniref:FAD-binding FR-type domain-containing protein n=2 Tax=Kutzneria TaxID=43356 RepID=W5W9S5_9PSEU|nr:FAD/NAD(P)-binding protein [Kutzneria albida]AHH97515.1 hypothetical protein KALB_4151 [Kutzneria albida DSM 43870]MBA8930547.1 NAD(P)H-flavin reductase [Kutzneria viridogrisea]
MSGDPLLPLPYVVTDRAPETDDTVTLRLKPVRLTIPRLRPGQFTMLYVRGVGEIPISISGNLSVVDGSLTHTVREVGAVSRALCAAPVGTVIGVRGPFGTGWDLPSACDTDVLVVAGGLGLAPLRPVVLAALAQRWRYRRLILVVGARTPDDLLYRRELDEWARREDMAVVLTVDRPTQGWRGQVGFVTEPLSWLALDPSATTAFLCGPEPMMRFCASALLRRGILAGQIRLSLERNMQCGLGQCGHCQLGPLLVCWDGPVVNYAAVGALLTIKEL